MVVLDYPCPTNFIKRAAFLDNRGSDVSDMHLLAVFGGKSRVILLGSLAVMALISALFEKVFSH